MYKLTHLSVLLQSKSSRTATKACINFLPTASWSLITNPATHWRQSWVQHGRLCWKSTVAETGNKSATKSSVADYSQLCCRYSRICRQCERGLIVILTRWWVGCYIDTARRGVAGCGPAQSPPRCTKYNSLPIIGQCTNFVLFDVAVFTSTRCRSLIDCQHEHIENEYHSVCIV